MPSKTKRQQFTREYKIEVIRLASDGTKTVAEVSKELGIRPENSIGGGPV